MMKRILYFLLILAGCAIYTSCQDDDDDLSGQYDSVTGTDLYFEDYGLQVTYLSTLYSEMSYETVVKSTVDKDVKYSVNIDTAAIGGYNEVYEEELKLLPSSYYKLSSSNTIEGGSTDTLSIIFYVQKIANEIGIEESESYALPVVIEGEDSLGLIESMCVSIINLNVTEPVITLDAPLNIVMDDTATNANKTISLSASYNFNEIESSDISLEINESAVVDYNTANGTDYSVLPEYAYTYDGFTMDEEQQRVSFNYILKPDTLDSITYVMPVIISSDVYTVEGDPIVYNIIKIRNNKAYFIDTIDLTLYQGLNTNYITSKVYFDIDELANIFGASSSSEITNSMSIYNKEKNGTLSSNKTQGSGYWINFDTDVCSWGTENCALFYYRDAGTDFFIFGQYPSNWEVGKSCTAGAVLAYGDKKVLFRIKMIATPEIAKTNTSSISVLASIPSTSQPIIDYSSVAGYLSTTVDVVKSLDIYAVNASNGEVVENQTCSNSDGGFYFNTDGDVCEASGAAFSVVFNSASGCFDVTNIMMALTAGETYTATVAFYYNDLMVYYTFTITAS